VNRQAFATCPVCAGTSSATYVQFAQFEWLRCDCGAIYKRAISEVAANSLSTDGAVAVGPPSSTPDSFGEEGHYGRRYGARHAHRVAKSRRQILDALNHTPPGPLLDLGCSLGYTLEAARGLGLEAVGADLSPLAVQHCRDLGFETALAPLEALPFADRRFQIVTMKHVLEHTAQPRQALTEVRRVLAPGGAVFIAVPDAGYWKAHRDPARSRFYRPDAHGGAEHQVYYTPPVLARLVTASGFKVAAVHPQLLHRLAGPAARAGEMLLSAPRALGGLLRTSLRLRKEFWLVAVRD
jgi:SAM-dependent methyltransferase